MHPALQVAEIVGLICNSVDRDDDPETLWALARTATTFTHSALNGLWECQDTLFHVLSCLPADLWNVDDDSASELLRPVKQIDLERLLVHSARVKVLELTVEEVTPGISDLLDQIQPFLPRGFLFPNLRSITFETPEGKGLLGPHLSLFIPNTVTQICMNLEEINNSSLLPLLPPLNSSFTSVMLCMDRSPTHIERSLISTFVRALGRLTHLGVPTLDPAALKHVASLTTLKSFEIGCAGTDDLSTGLLQPTGFCALTNLSFYSTPFQFIADLIHGLSNSPVTSLYLNRCNLPTENTMRALCFALSSHLAHSTLSDLRMKNQNQPLDMGHGFGGHTISPLFCFSSMQTLELCAPGGFQLEDVTIWDLARAFPGLRRLSLTTSNGVYCAPGMTLDGLRAFVIHCPQLTHMRIAFNATVIPPAIDSATPNTFHMKLTGLDVLTSRISLPSDVARFLSGIFPVLVTLIHYHAQTQGGFTAQDCKNWDRVRDLLPKLADAHRKEQLGAEAP
ncbi:hypothetical protein C8J57DRAFT_1469342 [Mycena rebaudengoi]|nr:hypothetical protein C8J57DRAFT_1469342 [Mycena rebaudengoi]